MKSPNALFLAVALAACGLVLAETPAAAPAAPGVLTAPTAPGSQRPAGFPQRPSAQPGFPGAGPGAQSPYGRDPSMEALTSEERKIYTDAQHAAQNSPEVKAATEAAKQAQQELMKAL